MSFDARRHANESASGKPDLTRRGFLAATGALGATRRKPFRASGLRSRRGC